MNGPTGQTFEVEIDGQTRSIYIRPDFFTQPVMSRLVSLIKARKRDERTELLADLRKAGLTGEDMAAAIKTVINDFGDTSVEYEEAINALRLADGEALAIALELTSPDIQNREEARTVLNSCKNVVELIYVIIEAGAEAIQAAEKNSARLVAGATTDQQFGV